MQSTDKNSEIAHLQGFAKLRFAIECKFESWGAFCYRRPWLIILFAVCCLAYFSSYLPQIRVDTSTAGFLHEDDPTRQVYDQFQREFSRDEKALVLVKGDVFSRDFLEKMTALHMELESIDQVAQVDSLVNARQVYGEEEELIVDDLLEVLPETQAQMQALKKQVAENPVYRRYLINEQLDLVALVITTDNYSNQYLPGTPLHERPFISGEEIGRIVRDIDNVIAQFNSPGFTVSAAGSPHMMYLLTEILGQDMFLFSGLGILFIAIILAYLYRRLVMVVLPVLVSFLSLFFTFSLMAFFDIAVTTSVQILPSFLLAVGVGNSVHVFTAFFQGVNEGLDKRGALAYALGHSGLAVMMTGLTTAGGLLSFISAEIRPVSDFGIIAPMGILSSLFFSLALLPALIRISPIKSKAAVDDSGAWYQRFLAQCARLSTRSPKKVIAVWALLVLPALLLASQIKMSHTPLYWFPEDHDFRISTLEYDAEMGGSSYLEIIIDTQRENGVKDIAIQNAILEIVDFIQQLNVNGVQVQKSAAITDISKELNQALHANDKEYYRVPESQELLAQEYLLYELSGDEDMGKIVNYDFSKTRLTFQLPFTDAVLYPEYQAAVEKGVYDIVGEKAEVVFTGVLVMMGRTVYAMLFSTLNAYIMAFCIITPLMVFLIGSVSRGLLSMIPNLAPIILTLGLMQIVGIKLDAFTLLIGSIALGLAVDDTIHFMHNYQRFYALWGDSDRAVYETLRTTGQALLFTSTVLAVAFFINMFATMENLWSFGLLTGFCIMAAFLSDVLLAPAIVTLLARRKEAKQAKA